MRRLRAIAIATVIACCAALCGGALANAHRAGSSSSRPVAKKYPANLLVYAQEWSLWPSRTKLPAGTVDVQLWNRGEDSHDLRIRRLNAKGTMVGAVLGGVSVTPSGAVHKAVWHLTAGHYEIYCSLSGHMKMGMHAKIKVVD